MRIKIKGGTVQHGQTSLCVTCRHATVIQGTSLREQVVDCGRLYGNESRITFPVTSCTGYSDLRLPTRDVLVRCLFGRNRLVTKHALIEKIEALPPEKKAEVEDFVDFLASRDSTGTDADPAKTFPNQLLESIRAERERLRRERGVFDSLPYIREFRETEGR